MRQGPWAVRGQSIAEYTVVVAMVAMAVAGISTYLRRGLQANIKWQIDATLPIATKVADRPQECRDPPHNIGHTPATLWHCTQFYGTQPENIQELNKVLEDDPAKLVASMTTKVGQPPGGAVRSRLQVIGNGVQTTVRVRESGNPVHHEGTSVSVGRSKDPSEFAIRPKLPTGQGN